MQKPKLVYTTYIRSTPKDVWAAITKPEFTRQYWGDMTNVGDWKKGSKWEHHNPEGEVWITGKVLESNPPKRLVLSWADPDDLADKSRVTFEIIRIGPAQYEAFGWRGFQDFAGDPDFALGIVVFPF